MLLASNQIIKGGNQQALVSSIATHNEAVALARQIRVFSADGPCKFNLPSTGLPLDDAAALNALWLQWVTAETTKRQEIVVQF